MRATRSVYPILIDFIIILIFGNNMQNYICEYSNYFYVLLLDISAIVNIIIVMYYLSQEAEHIGCHGHYEVKF
jgi:hypothetical protein